MKVKRQHRLSIKQWVVATLLLGMLATTGSIIYDIEYSMHQLQDETGAQYLSILEMQRSSLDTNLRNASAALLNYKASGKHMSELMRCDDVNDAYFAVANITSDLESQILHSTISEIAYARKKTDEFDRFGISLSPSSYLTSSEKVSVESYVKNMDIDSAGTDYTWRPCLIGNEWYFVYNITGKDYVIGQGIRVKTIIDLFKMNAAENSAIVIFNDDGTSMANSDFAQKNNVKVPDNAGMKSAAYVQGNQLVVSSYCANLHRPVLFVKEGLISQSFNSIILMLQLTVFAVFAIFLLVFSNISKALLTPLKRMQKCIGEIRDGSLETKIAISDNVPVEFLDTYQTLNEMTSRIRELKISSYENELARKQYEIQFLSMQIEPHFYLNSMKYIYALAQTQQYSKLKPIILNLSDYFRYLTYDSEKTVPLQKELEHIEHYLAIINAGSVNHINASLQVDRHAETVLVPKLLVQTFMENAVKYGASESRDLEVDIEAYVFGEEGAWFLQLKVSDDGNGFDDAYLSEIKENGFSDHAGHIGLSNLYNRLSLLYPAGQTYMTIRNNESGGATAEVIIPAGFAAPGGEDVLGK